MKEPPNAAHGMDKMQIRHMLMLAHDEPLHAAVALGGDGKAIILLDRHKPPRTLEREIKEQAPGSHMHRFGTLRADPDNPHLARFTVNRASPGMARKLVMALKGTGLRRVEIGSEDGRDLDAAQNDDGDDHPQDYDPAQARQAAQAEEATRHARLMQDLGGLVHQIVAVESPARRALLAGLAAKAQAGLKGGDLIAAAEAMASLRRALASEAH